MLLRICLIVASLGAGAVVAVNYVMVKPAIETAITARDNEKQQKESAQKELASTKKDRDAAKASLATANKSLTDANAALATARNAAQALATKYTDSTNKLVEAQGQRDKLQAEMVKWDQTHIRPEDVPVLQSNLVKATKAREGVEQENELLLADLEVLGDRVKRIEGTNGMDQNPPLPPGLRGQIVAVDPKYSFVILNMGEDKKLLVNGIMLVAREGRLIAKVQIARVDKTQSVANILPAWRRSDVMEGDEVID